MSSAPNFLIHPGYPKCGSTSLQSNVFAEHDDIRYLSYNSALDDPVRGNPINLEFHNQLYGNKPRNKGRLHEIWRTHFLPSADPEKLNVISEEKFLTNNRAAAEIAIDLHEIIGEAKVLIVVRDQADILRSLYDMHPWAPNDAARRFATFGVWLDTVLGLPEVYVAPALRFCSVFGTYVEVFGAEAVKVVSIKRLIGDPSAQDLICSWLDIDAESFRRLMDKPAVNKASDHGYKKLSRRLLGPIRMSSFLSVGQIATIRKMLSKLIPDKKTEISALDRKRIETFFAGERIEDLVATGAQGLLL